MNGVHLPRLSENTLKRNVLATSLLLNVYEAVVGAVITVLSHAVMVNINVDEATPPGEGKSPVTVIE